MADEKAVEKGTEAAGAAEVKKEGGDASDSQGLDLVETLEKTLEKLQQAETERDNYKRGMLKAKGKTTSEEDEPEAEDLDTRIADAVTKAISSKEATESTQKLIKRVKEMEEALKNKSQISTAGQGTGSESPLKVGDNVLSEAQISELKRQGKSDEWITRFKQNLLKVR